MLQSLAPPSVEENKLFDFFFFYFCYVLFCVSIFDITIGFAPNLALFQHVIRGNRPIKAEMAHQLYVLQVLTFNLLEERMMTKMDPNDQVR